MKTLHRHLLTAIAVASLAACSSVPLDSQAPVESRTGSTVVPGAGSGSGANSAGTSQTRVAPVDVTGTSNVNFTNLPKVVYFDFDSYVVKDDYRPVIEANAKALASNRRMHMSVQGHTDDRGSSEYNLALGQRRAEAVVKSLTLLGADPTQLEAVSFGEERPAVQGENEEAWAKNRRAELASR
jgi:peptidoglycan-associated lipoprotein